MEMRKLAPVLLMALSTLVLFAQTRDSESKDSQKLKALTSGDFIDGRTPLAGMKLLGVESQRIDQGTEDERGLEETILVELRGNRLSIQENEPFDLERIEKIAEKVKEILFSFGYVEATITPLAERLNDGRLRVYYAIQVGDIVRTVNFQFSGTHLVGSSELISIMNKCMESRSRCLDRSTINYCAGKDVRSYLFSKGLLKAVVRPAKFETSKNGAFILIEVDEGVRFEWGRFDLVGNKVFSKKQILDGLGQTKGEIANAQSLTEFFEEKLKNWYAEKGYAVFSADITPELILPTKAGVNGTANVKIDINEGRQFKVREIRFVGIDEDRSLELLRQFSLKAGETYIPSKLDRDIKKLNERKEFQEVDRDTNVDFLTDDERANIVIVINLHPIT